MPSIDPASTWDVFVSYGPLHALSVTVGTAFIGALALAGRALRRNGHERRLRIALVVFAGSFWLIYNIWWNWNGIDPYDGIPLHICDIGGILAPFALLTQNRWARATLYFWAFGFTLQAYVQPTVTAGPAHLLFWAFWISHTLIIATAVYEIAVLDFRPGWADLRRATLTSLAYLAVVFPVDIWLGSNYGYVGNPPPPRPIPPFVEFLGAWPGRVALMAALAGLAFVLLLLPWFARRPSTREHEEMRPGEAPGEARP